MFAGQLQLCVCVRARARVRVCVSVYLSVCLSVCLFLCASVFAFEIYLDPCVIMYIAYCFIKLLTLLQLLALLR